MQVSIVNGEHYVNVARRVAGQLTRGSAHDSGGSERGSDGEPGSGGSGGSGAVFCDQFETGANFRAHLETTGPEIWRQTCGRVDAFVCGAGTGGTLAGVAAHLKSVSRGSTRCFLVDPPGSVLYNRVVHGVAFAEQQAERTLRRHRYDTIIEGVGLDRLTANFNLALPHLDGGFQCTDAEAIAMSRWILAKDGVFAGSSTAMNLVGAVRTARTLRPGSVIVTIVCDSGLRHLSRFWSSAVADAVDGVAALAELGLPVDGDEWAAMCGRGTGGSGGGAA